MNARPLLIALRNMLIGSNARSLRLLSNPHKAVYYAGECLFLDRCLNSRSDLPQRHTWDVLGTSSGIQTTIIPGAADEWFRVVPSFAVDLVSLCMLAKLLQPRIIFEIGTLNGSGALHLAVNTSADVYTLDLAPGEEASLYTTPVDTQHICHRGKKLWFVGTLQEDRIHPLYGDSAKFDFKPYSVDLFFIDGAHSYEYVRNDTLKALSCTRKGGVIAWHDYGRCGVNGVTRWLHELRETGRQIYRVPGGSLAYMIVD